jgi:hypothetical protein
MVMDEARTAAAGDAQATGWEMRRRAVRPPSDWKNVKQKARSGFLRPGFVSSRDDVDMPLICPTCQILFSVYRNNCENDGAPVQ